MRQIKGQTLVFEQVILFVIGVMIFIVCFFSFSAYQSYFSQAGKTDQLEQVSNYIAYAIVKTSESWNSTSSYFTINIPTTIGGEIYRVELLSYGLNVTTLPSMNYSFTNLYGIYKLTELDESEVSSTNGKVVLYKNGNKIILT